jgi:hypothetical protein
MKISNLKTLVYESLHQAYLDFAGGRAQALLPVTSLTFHRGDHVELDDPGRFSSTIAQVYPTKAGKPPSSFEAYLRMTPSQYQALLSKIQVYKMYNGLERAKFTLG